MKAETKQRFSRQIKLASIGEEGQQRLQDATVLILGMGGLGSPVAIYLAAAGVGHLMLADYDVVDLSNLQRQIIHRYHDIGRLKTHSARDQVRALNPEITVSTIDYLPDEGELLQVMDKVDLIIDCTDNFPSRFGLNRVAFASKTPLVSGAAIRFEGQVTTFQPNDGDSPCYQCLYPDLGIESATCEFEGVVAPVVGIIGTMQAQEALNTLLGKPALVGKLWLFDAKNMDWQSIRLPKNPKCTVCGG